MDEHATGGVGWGRNTIPKEVGMTPRTRTVALQFAVFLAIEAFALLLVFLTPGLPDEFVVGLLGLFPAAFAAKNLLLRKG